MRTRRKTLMTVAGTTILAALLGGALLHENNTDAGPQCGGGFINTIHEARGAPSEHFNDIECEIYSKGGTCVEWDLYDMPADTWGYNNMHPEAHGDVLPYNRARRPAPWLTSFGGGGSRKVEVIQSSENCEIPEPHILLVLALGLAGFASVRWASKD